MTKRRLCCNLLWARPRGFFFLSCLATFGVWPLTFPARANEPCTFPAIHYDTKSATVLLREKKKKQHVEENHPWLITDESSGFTGSALGGDDDSRLKLCRATVYVKSCSRPNMGPIGFLNGLQNQFSFGSSFFQSSWIYRFDRYTVSRTDELIPFLTFLYFPNYNRKPKVGLYLIKSNFCAILISDHLVSRDSRFPWVSRNFGFRDSTKSEVLLDTKE